MKAFSKLVFGNQPPKEFADSEEVAQVRGTRTPDLKRTDELHKLQQSYNELSHAYRHQQLDKREVADTKKWNAKLEETLQKRSEDSRKAQERYSSLLRKYNAQMGDVEKLALAKKTSDDLRKTAESSIEANFRSHQQEMILLKGELRSQTAGLDEMEMLKAAAEHKAEQLRSELDATRGQLQLCKDDLFRLQPMAQVPDTEIIKAFESVCQDVISWIDVEISAFEKLYPSAEPSEIFSGGALPEAIHLLEQYPTLGEYLVRYVVHSSLHETMFSRSVYLLGLPEETKQCLQAAEDRMATFKQSRGFETINEWRSETLTAIAATPKFVVDRDAAINDIAEGILQTVGQYFPAVRLQEQSKRRFLEEVVLPAATLATKFQVTASIYEFHIPTYPFRKYEPVTIDDHKSMKMIDVKTRKKIKGSSATVEDRERRIGDIVIPLEPSLWRINENEESTLLRPEANLIELYQPLAKRIKTSA